jgi:hypothetical protein
VKIATVRSDFTSYVGLASPMDFSGMVRHYYLRQGDDGGHRVNLVSKNRSQQATPLPALRDG